MTPDEDKSSGELEPRRSSDLTASGGLIRMGRERAALIRPEQEPRLTIQTLQPPATVVAGSAHFIKGGTRTATVGAANFADTVRIWDLASGDQLEAPDLPPDGKVAFAPGADSWLFHIPYFDFEGGLVARVFDLASGSLLRESPLPLDTYALTDNFCASPDGRCVASTHDKGKDEFVVLVGSLSLSADYVELDMRRQAYLLPPRVTLSQDGRFALVDGLVSGGEGRSLDLWDTRQGTIVWAREYGGSEVSAFGDGCVVSFGGHGRDPLLLDLNSLEVELVPEIGGLWDRVPGPSFLEASYDGSVFIMASKGGVLARWTRGHEPRVFARARKVVKDIAVSREGDAVIVYCEDGSLLLYDLL